MEDHAISARPAPWRFNSDATGRAFVSLKDLVMAKIEDEVIVTPGIDAAKLKSPRGLFRLSGQNAPKTPEAPSRWPKTREERAFPWNPGEVVFGPDRKSR